jgi:DNA polymerase-3 subunit alpha
VKKLAGTVAGRQERKSARGNRFAFAQLSAPTGAYEVTVFSEALEKCRDFLETGAKVVVTVEATLESDQLKLLGRSIMPVEQVVAGAGASGLKIYVEGAEVLGQLASVLTRAAEQMPKAARGPIHLCFSHEKLPGEVEMDLQQQFPVTPEIKGAVKSLDGVLAVEDF